MENFTEWDFRSKVAPVAHGCKERSAVKVARYVLKERCAPVMGTSTLTKGKGASRRGKG